MTRVFWVQLAISSIGGGAVSTVVGLFVVRVLKKFVRPLFGGQEEIKSLAQTAADQSTHAAGRAAAAEQQSAAAAVSAGTAHDSAQVAEENSRLANEAILHMAAVIDVQAERIRDLTDSNDDMADRISGLLGTRARQLAAERQTQTGGLLLPRAAADADDAATVTGRHALHHPHEGAPS